MPLGSSPWLSKGCCGEPPLHPSQKPSEGAATFLHGQSLCVAAAVKQHGTYSLSLSLSLSLSRPCECQLACAAPALVVSGPDDLAAGPKRGASRVLFASVSSNPREDATSVPNTGHAQRIPPQARCIDVSTRQVCCSQVRSPHTRAARRRVASQVASASPAPVPASRCRRRAAS